MKNIKKYFAILAIVVLLAAFCLPMIFALTGDFSEGAFKASMAVAMFVPVMAFIMIMVYRWLNSKTPKQPEREIENIIFDVGRVLVGFEHEPLLNSFGFSEEKKQKIIQATFKNQLWNEMDRGLYENEKYFEGFIAEAPEYEEDIKEVIRRAPETVFPLPYTETWLKYLKNQGYRLYVLSNYGNYMLDATRHHLGFLEYMDGAIFSCEVQMIKPEPDIFKKLMEMYSIDPKKSVFIDDRADNCETARKLGMKAIQFKEFKQAAADLEKLGVK